MVGEVVWVGVRYIHHFAHPTIAQGALGEVQHPCPLGLSNQLLHLPPAHISCLRLLLLNRGTSLALVFVGQATHPRMSAIVTWSTTMSHHN